MMMSNKKLFNQMMELADNPPNETESYHGEKKKKFNAPPEPTIWEVPDDV